MSSTPTEGRGRHRGIVASRSGRVARRSVQVVAAALSVVLFAGFAYGWYSYRALTGHTRNVDISGLGADPTSGASGGATVQHVNGAAQNILIVGVDSRSGLTDAQKRFYKVGLNDESTSTDTIIVLHVPADGKQATLVSIPRDTYVQIPGFPPNKINAAYADGYYNTGASGAKAQEGAGASKLVATVKQLTGLTIDHYVQVGFSGFVDIVRAIGNVPINLCRSVDDTFAYNRSIGGSGGSGFKMSAGHHDLTPQESLEFVRQRHNIPGPVSDDLGRELRQRYFLKQAFAKIASARVLLDPVKLRHLITAVDGAFTFDNKNFGILQFAEQMSDLTAGNITGKSIPVTGQQTYGNDVGQALTVDPAQVRKFVHKTFFGAPPPAKPAPAGSVSTSPSAPASGPKVSSSGSAGSTSTCVY